VVYNGGDIAWTLASTALVWIMVPGVGFFYSGLLRRKNGLSMIYLSVGTIAVVSFQVSLNTLPSQLNSIWCESGSSGASLWHSAILLIFSLVTYVSISLTRFWRCRSGYLHVSCRLLRAEWSARETFYWQRSSSIDRLLCLPVDVCCNYVRAS
jgi:Ammonium Transporter Family